MSKTMRNAFALTMIVGALSLLLIRPAAAQSVYGSIFGTVTDRSGAVIPNAAITVTDEAKGTVFSVVSNGAGDYSVPHLIPDVYDLKVVAKGFKPFETKGIQVLADTAPRIDPSLEVGSDTGTTIEVNAEAVPLLKTEKADVATIFDQQQVSSLPVGDQNFTNIQLLLPGAQLLGWSHAADENPQGSQQIQIDGQAFGGTAFELDGTDNQDPILGIIVINPAMDAVTETKITTQNYDAELGKAVSAVVTAQTRSGTNNLHGSAYDFRTGNANKARDPYGQAAGPNAIPPGLKNRFGGSIGGRVIKDKFFYFGNYEAQRQKVGTSYTDSVPTAHLIASCLGTEAPYYGGGGVNSGCDFSEYAAILAGTTGGVPVPLIWDNSLATPAPFANNVIPTARLSPAAMKLLSYMKNYAPNNTGGAFSPSNTQWIGNNFSEGGTGLFNSNAWTTREDYTINDKMHTFVRFSRFWDVLSGKVMFGDAGGPGFGINNYGGNSKGANDSLAAGMDIALKPTLLTDFRLGYYRYNVIDSKYDQSTQFGNTLGIPGVNTGSYFTSGAPGFEIAGGNQTSYIGAGLGINRCNCPLTEKEDQGQIVNNWTMVKGNHTLKVGVDLRYGRNLRVPSDTDRTGQFNFDHQPTSNNGSLGNGWASYALGEINYYGRYVSTSTNAKEFQKRTFFYGQDTWRLTKNLTLNLGLRWELYFPESVNGKGNGSLMNLDDGYMHVAGYGAIPSDMGWNISKVKGLDPRIGVMYQIDDKTVIRAGYGRSFDTGVFGSIFGHVVTQNLPVLASQTFNQSGNTGALAFTLDQGPPAYVFPAVPATGLLPAQGYAVSPKARPNPLHFPTIDAWNLAIQRAITPTMSITVAYVGNKGTHTLGDGDSNNTNPNEGALFLPAQYSVTGQSLHWDPNGLTGTLPAGYSGGVADGRFLQRYYGGRLLACSDPAYARPSGSSNTNLSPGMCGWNNGISYYGDDQNTEFDALQINIAKSFTKGLSLNANYQWAAAFDENSGYYTWSHSVPHMHDSNVRQQQLISYGSYDLPFGKGKQFAQNANRITDEIIGGFQLSYVLNWSSGLPWTIGYDQFNPWTGSGKAPAGWNVEDCNASTGGTAAPCRPNATGHMKTHLTAFNPSSSGTGNRSFFTAQPRQGGMFSWPGLDNIGNAGANNYWGPSFFNTDLGLTKAFTIRENIVTKFRMDAFNGFNHINAGNPNNGDVFGSLGTATGAQLNNIGGEAPGPGPRQLEFSLRVQF